MMGASAALICLLALGQGGEIRHELGVRLRAMEAALKDNPDAQTRARAVPGLKDTTMLFFTGQFGNAGQLLDNARRILKDEPEWDNQRAWAESLSVRLQPKIVEAGRGELTLEITPFYPTTGVPAKGKVEAVIAADGLPEKRISLGDLPLKEMVKFDWAEGTRSVVIRLISGEKVLARRELSIHAQKDLKNLLASWKATLAKGAAKTIAQETLAHLEDLVSSLATGKALETDYPAAKLIQQGKEIQEALEKGKTWPEGNLGAGEYWVALPEGLAPRVVRIMVPQTNNGKTEKLPCVFALHGAGGSENLFFDGYGVGEAVRQCQSRGWILVSPRLAPGSKTLEKLAEILPMDASRVVVVGHSMGAAQASALASAQPAKFKAAAYLGGGGRVGKGAEFATLPAFVGVGNLDFALGSAKSLHQALVKAGVKKAVFKEYPSVDHLAIVQLALPDAFAFFDEALLTR